MRGRRLTPGTVTLTGPSLFAAFQAQPRPPSWDWDGDDPWAKYYEPEPLVKEHDPELERILAEELEIENATAFLSQPGLCDTVGDLRGMLAAFPRQRLALIALR